jgi:hypothetical protein
LARSTCVADREATRGGVGECVDDETPRSRAFFEWLFHTERGTEIFFVSLRDSKQARDKDIKILRAFRSLGMLDLSNTSVTDECIVDLAALRSLIWLDITRTGITDAGEHRLRLSLPNCELFTDGGS